MTTITITKDEAGKLVGFTERDARALGRWRSMVDNLETGELLDFEVKFAVNRRFHNLVMRCVRDIFEAQEYFEDFDVFRLWIYIHAGHCVWEPGATGGIVPVPKSFSDKDNDDEEKRVVFDKIKAAMRSGKPGQRLWKHLNESQRAEMVETILAPYEEQVA